tara:strand:- start:93 stop:491 length:399 start_codon:yes stop_codon:yes gene_type:complete
MGRVLTKYELNEFKIALAVLRNRETSYQLIENKLYTIADMLSIGDSYEIDMGLSVDDLLDPEVIIQEPEPEELWVSGAKDLIRVGRWKEFRELILDALVRKNAFLEVIDLGLDKIKLETQYEADDLILIKSE